MSAKTARLAALVEPFAGQELPPQYLAFLDCFNRQLFFEAHEVLEEIWLPQRNGADGAFYKGLIQLAGAFVHVQKGRTGPARALLACARGNLQKYPPFHHQLAIPETLRRIEDRFERLLAAHAAGRGLAEEEWPQLRLGLRAEV